jgi:hypothetical protein
LRTAPSCRLAWPCRPPSLSATTSCASSMGAHCPPHHEPRSVLLTGGLAHVGLSGAALCPAVGGELGDRRPRRPTSPGPLIGHRSGGRPPVDQPTPCRHARDPAAAQPILSQPPPLSKRTLCVRRGGAGCRRGRNRTRALDRCGPCAQPRARIDRDAIFRLKMQALEHLWPEFGGDPAFDSYCHKQGTALQQFATFCAWPSTMAGDGRPGPPSIAAPMRRQWRGSLLNVPTASASISGHNGSSTCS